MAYWRIHTVAWCETCGKEFHNWKNAQALAAQHAKIITILPEGKPVSLLSTAIRREKSKLSEIPV